MAFSSQIQYGTMTSITSASLTGTYQAFGSPLAEAASIVKIVNNGTTDVTISTDGTHDHDFIPLGAFALYDVSSDKPSSNNSFMPRGTQFFIKGSAGTGSIYLVYMFPVQT